MDLGVARSFLIALAIGALVGLEREKKKASEPAHSFGGIRTHILLALVGAASAWLSRTFTVPWVFLVTLAVVGAAVVASYVHQNRGADDAPGLTSEVAAVGVCLLGAMAVLGEPELAAALGIGMSAVLAFKQPLHGLVRRVNPDDLHAAIKLLVASFIVLPLLPDAAIDPWGAINPYKLWLLVVMISALSLIGYVAMRWLGTTHGTAITGITGGLVSSTAATLSFARTSRIQPDTAHAHGLAAGILLAWLVMFVRVLVLLAIVNRPLLSAAWLPFAAMALAALVFAAWHYRIGLSAAANGKGEGEAVDVSNPFSLGSAMKFAALFAVVLVAVELTQRYAPGAGVLAVAALAGSVDVDAITLSLADQAHEAAELSRTGTAIAIAAVANTIVKCATVLILGRGKARAYVGVSTLAILAAGLAVIALA